jgi:hypothetical protein
MGIWPVYSVVTLQYYWLSNKKTIYQNVVFTSFSHMQFHVLCDVINTHFVLYCIPSVCNNTEFAKVTFFFHETSHIDTVYFDIEHISHSQHIVL